MSVGYNVSTGTTTSPLLHKHENDPDVERAQGEVIYNSHFQRWTRHLPDNPWVRYSLAGVILPAVFVLGVFVPIALKSLFPVPAKPTKGLTTVPPDNITTPTKGLTTVPPDNITTRSPATNYTAKDVGVAKTHYENLQDYAIPDLGLAISIISVSRAVDSDFMDVTFKIEHESVADIQIVLQCPSGQTKTLREAGVGSGENFLHLTQRIYMTGCDSKGDWKLEVKDTSAENKGTLKSWALDFHSLETFWSK